MSKKIFLGTCALFAFLSGGLIFHHVSKPTVSVIMSTYNRADLLPRAIKSILNQTYKDFEFIIVDDGSTDHTENILLGFANKDSRIKLIKNKKNLGLIASRNKSLEAARGKYIAIMDSDDQAFPNRLEKTLKVFKENPDVDAVSAATYNLDKQLDAEIFLNWGEYHKIDNDFSISMMFKNTFPNPAAMYKTDFIRKHKIRYNAKYESAEDYEFWKQFIFNGGKIITIYEPLTLIQRHSSHSDAYYQKMADSTKKIHAEFISRFYKPEENEIKSYYDPLQQCQIIEKIIPINKEKHIVDHESLLQFKKKDCPSSLSESYYVKDLGWEDFITKEKDSYIRFSNKEKVNVAKDGDVLTITMPDSQIVKFKKYSDSEKYLRYSDKVLFLKHINWEDELYLLDEKLSKYCRFSNQDCGTITIRKGTLELKWDNPHYPIEKFRYDKKNNQYIQE